MRVGIYSHAGARFVTVGQKTAEDACKAGWVTGRQGWALGRSPSPSDYQPTAPAEGKSQSARLP